MRGLLRVVYADSFVGEIYSEDTSSPIPTSVFAVINIVKEPPAQVVFFACVKDISVSPFAAIVSPAQFPVPCFSVAAFNRTFHVPIITDLWNGERVTIRI